MSFPHKHRQCVWIAGHRCSKQQTVPAAAAAGHRCAVDAPCLGGCQPQHTSKHTQAHARMCTHACARTTPFPTGGEIVRAEEMTEDSYLRRWLRARNWDVDVAARCIVSHAEWRMGMMPQGSIAPVGAMDRVACRCVGADDATQTRQCSCVVT